MTAHPWTFAFALTALIQLPGSVLLLTVLFGVLEGGPDYFPNLCQVLGVLQGPPEGPALLPVAPPPPETLRNP